MTATVRRAIPWLLVLGAFALGLACGSPQKMSYGERQRRANEIIALDREIAGYRLQLGLPPRPSPEALSLPAFQTEAPIPVAEECRDVCDVGRYICEAKDDICRIAGELGDDAWAQGKCRTARASCREAQRRCADCNQAR